MKYFIIIASMITFFFAAPALSAQETPICLYDKAYSMVDFLNIITEEIETVEAEHEHHLRLLKSQIRVAKEELRNINLKLLAKKENLSSPPCKKSSKLERKQELLNTPLNLW